MMLFSLLSEPVDERDEHQLEERLRAVELFRAQVLERLRQAEADGDVST